MYILLVDIIPNLKIFVFVTTLNVILMLHLIWLYLKMFFKMLKSYFLSGDLFSSNKSNIYVFAQS